MIEIITEDLNSNKITLKQGLTLSYEVGDEYLKDQISEDEILEAIEFDETTFSQDLADYLRTYDATDDEFRKVYNAVNRVETDFEGDQITIYLTLGMKFSDETLKYVFDDFIKEVAMDDTNFNGSLTMSIEPTESEPYETGFNSLTDTIEYSSSTIDEVEVDYNFQASGMQTIQIN